ncbi:MAG: UDP-N-acetylmuramyl-tripeptide synthetase [bacterium]
MTQDHLFQRIKNQLHLVQSILANLKYRFPGRQLKLIAVTGTDGKTTTTSLIYHILQNSGHKTAFLSTVTAKIAEKEIDTGLHVTTPDPWMVPKYLRQIVDEGIEYAVIEATSNGLQQNRLWGLQFMAAVITNIGYDHLDFHGNWENYARAKFALTKKIVKDGLLVLNLDHEKSVNWLQKRLKNKQQRFQIKWFSKEQAQNIAADLNGISFDYNGQKFFVSLIGAYNLENVLAAIDITNKFLKLSEIALALKTFPSPLGRMQVMSKSPTVIVDFAHTPQALTAALQAIISIKSKRSRVITLFGCAGKRDKGRRAMGAISAELSDITILTAEDPRDETLQSINDEIFTYAKTKHAVLLKRWKNHQEYLAANVPLLQEQIVKTLYNQEKPFFAFDEDSIQSRADAIDFALKIARPEDIVDLTGKGHERSLSFGTEEQEFPWSDQDAVRKLLGK